MATVSWPRACIGCGETNPAALLDHSYTYKHSRETGRTPSGYNQVTVHYEVTTLPVSAFVCAPCKAAARRRFVAILIGLLVWMIGSWVIMSTVTGSDYSEAFIAFLVSGMVTTIATIFWAIWRLNPTRHYHKVRYHTYRGYFSYVFRSPAYLAHFMRANPGKDKVKVRSTFP